MPRPKGAVNNATKQIRSFCRNIINDPEYQRRFIERARKGTLGAALEIHCWDRAFGKVKDNVDVNVTGPNEYDAMTPKQLEERIRELLDRVKEARETQ